MTFKYFELLDIRWADELPPIHVLYNGKIPLALAKSPKNARKTLSGFAKKHDIPVTGHFDVCALNGRPTGDKYIRVLSSGECQSVI